MSYLCSFNPARRKFLIISGYHENESYGLLGPQMAATIIEKFAEVECCVIGVCRDFDKDLLKKEIYHYFGNKKPVIGFSTLLGRKELFLLAKELKEEGMMTILAGPQADVDFLGEKGWKKHVYRFEGFWKCFDFAIHGPAEQLIPFLTSETDVNNLSGAVVKTKDGFIIKPRSNWNDRFMGEVNWNNLYSFKTSLKKINISCAQIIHHIGCPYAAKKKRVLINYPSHIHKEKTISIETRGCSFCDVAVDKGYCGSLSLKCILNQLESLPEDGEGRKIPFEIINENPIPFLTSLLNLINKTKLKLSQINLTLRPDWLLKNIDSLNCSLKIAKENDIKILISSIGFESFDDKILINLNKGTNCEINIKCIKTLRNLKEKYPDVFFYSREDGAIHGFIHPTPWDDENTRSNIQKRIFIYNLHKDILPYHSTPLIIHHASALAEWIRNIEFKENITFPRDGNIIHWWSYEKI